MVAAVGKLNGAPILAFVLWFNRSAASTPTPWLAGRSSQTTDFLRKELFPSLSPDGNTIVYARRTDGYWKIFTQRVGGYNAQNLTESQVGVRLEFIDI